MVEIEHKFSIGSLPSAGGLCAVFVVEEGVYHYQMALEGPCVEARGHPVGRGLGIEFDGCAVGCHGVEAPVSEELAYVSAVVGASRRQGEEHCGNHRQDSPVQLFHHVCFEDLEIQDAVILHRHHAAEALAGHCAVVP